MTKCNIPLELAINSAEELKAMLKNVGVDLECGQCAAIFYSGHGLSLHTCGIPNVPADIVVTTLTKEEEAEEDLSKLMLSGCAMASISAELCGEYHSCDECNPPTVLLDKLCEALGWSSRVEAETALEEVRALRKRDRAEDSVDLPSENFIYACAACGQQLPDRGMCKQCSKAWGIGRTAGFNECIADVAACEKEYTYLGVYPDEHKTCVRIQARLKSIHDKLSTKS